ncbi:MAG TPA: biotin/lipoyl-binding protein [Acidobacteriaceae bacterium]|nr:biotin/lipoyl-binding protein [Acidobacteriaceae bacterium]
MKNKILFVLAFCGLVGGSYVSHLSTITHAAQAPAFTPASNPYSAGIYAEGIVESAQSSGENVSMYPEVAGTVSKIYVREGEMVHKGALLLQIDDSIERATVAQQEAQAQAAKAMLGELRAEPRKETLMVNVAQVKAAEASLKTAKDELEKQQTAYALNPGSVSKDALDSAVNAESVAETNLAVTKRQYELTKAGAWIYDIRNQEKQYVALVKEHDSSSALLAKYALRAPEDGVVLSINTIPGAYVSSQGAYDAYTQGYDPVLSFGESSGRLDVRCYVDEILISRLPAPSKMKATMTIRGTDTHIPLTLERIQPLVSPKIELSDQRQERVDVRVLPLIFQFEKPKDVNLYPGELVDVYIGQ